MDLKLLLWTLYIILECCLHTSANNDGVCETNVMELHFGTRVQVVSKIDLYYTWCGHNFCYKTRQKLSAGGGVESFSEWRKKQICCEGYKEITPGLKPVHCEPACTAGCINGNCTAPNVCTCLTGYSVKTSYECSPICVNGCVNGECAGPNVCTCNDGYASSTISHLCMPVCDNDCTNGFCISPNKCQCFSGYKSDEKSSNICNPACVEGCINGVCTAPDNCTCNQNFEMDKENKHKCNPICIGGCMNGYCSDPGVCSCWEGYIPDDNSPQTICKPLCEKGCRNGTCAAPEFCSCSEGYKVTDTLDECLPVCLEECINGTCTEPGVCTTLEGFTSDPDNFNEYTLPMEDPYKSISSELVQTQCNKFNTTVNDYVCFSSDKEHLKRLDRRKCQFVNRLEIHFDCDCSTTLECVINIEEQDRLQHLVFDVRCVGNSSDNKSDRINVQVVASSYYETSCQWCQCPSNVSCDESQFQFSYCPSVGLETSVHSPSKRSGHAFGLIILVVGLGLLALILVAGSMTGLLLWRRHRRVNYALRYKERQNCNSHDNKAFERTHDLISEDDDSEQET